MYAVPDFDEVVVAAKELGINILIDFERQRVTRRVVAVLGVHQVSTGMFRTIMIVPGGLDVAVAHEYLCCFSGLRRGWDKFHLPIPRM